MRKKVLLVDDEVDLLKVVTFRLNKSGYEVISAQKGEEALELIKGKPDLVLLDICLPGMSGVEVCSIIKGDEGLKKIPVLLLTASTPGIVIEQAKRCGADDYLIKPFEAEALLEKVKKFLGE